MMPCMKMSTFVIVHVGQSTESQRNLEHGIETLSWGFPEKKPEYDTAQPRFAILATGASPASNWRTGCKARPPSTSSRSEAASTKARPGTGPTRKPNAA